MFFVASKVLAVLLQPLAHPYILLLAALVMRLMRKRRAMRIFIWLAVLLPLSYGVLPVSTWPLRGLENSYPVPVIDQPVDGIIVLGGHTGSGEVSASRNQAQQNGAADRLTKGLMLHRQHPGSLLVFSGFSGQLKPKGWNEAEITRRLLVELGIEKRGITFELTSRNTWENAVNTLEVAVPQPGSRWVLVTSASHMPRAMGAFEAAGWDGLIAYPADYQTTAEGNGLFDLPIGFKSVGISLHEYVGSFVYWLTGRSSRPFG
ncbi:MAG: YdcF family protein [SAR116 cluster bacterium]